MVSGSVRSWAFYMTLSLEIFLLGIDYYTEQDKVGIRSESRVPDKERGCASGMMTFPGADWLETRLW